MTSPSRDLFAPFPFPAPPALPRKLVELAPLPPSQAPGEGYEMAWRRQLTTGAHRTGRSRDRGVPRKLSPLQQGEIASRRKNVSRFEESISRQGVEGGDREERQRVVNTQSLESSKGSVLAENKTRLIKQMQPVRRKLSAERATLDSSYAPMLSNIDSIIKKNRKKLARL